MNSKEVKGGFIETCVKKPIIPIVISIFVLLLGFFALFQLEIRNTPKIPANHFVIYGNTINPQSAEELDKISMKIQKKLSSVPGVDTFDSTSEQGSYKIKVNFKPGIKEATAFNDLRSAIASTRLGAESKPPQIWSQSDDDAMLVIDFYPKDEGVNKLYFDILANFLKNALIPNLKKIEGVGTIDLRGYSKPCFALELNLLKMSKLGIRPQDVDYRISQETKNMNLAPIKTNTKSFSFSAVNTINSKDALESIVIDSRKGIYLRDIAKVTIQTKDPTSVSLLNGKTPTIKLIIYKTSDGNPLLVAKEVNKLLKELVSAQETSYKIKNNYERSEVIFQKTKQTFLEATILLFVILILFLGSIRILILPLVAIPLSILGTFVFMWQLGLSINEITLMAFLLSIGLLVDDAILVIEKIERDKHRSHGVFNEDMVIQSTLDIYKSVIVMTATLFCVFLPIVFLPGDMGYTLREFAVTIAVSVGWSCIFSLILTPMMCKYFMQNYQPFAWTEKWLKALEDAYVSMLRFLLRYRVIVLFFTFSLTVASGFLFTSIKSEYVPTTKNDYFYIQTHGLQNFKMEYLREEGDKITKILSQYKELDHFYLDISNGEIEIRGKIPGQKEVILDKIRKDLNAKIPYITFPSYGSNDDNLYFEMIFSSYNDKNYIENSAYEFMEKLEKTKTIKEYIFIKNTSYSYSLEIDKLKCQNKNTSPEEVRSILEFLLQTHKMSGKVMINNEKYRILVYHSGDLAANIKKLNALPWKIHSNNGTQQVLTLQDVVSIKPIVTNNSVEKFNGLSCKCVRVICNDNVKAGTMHKIIRDLQKKELSKDLYINFTKDLKTYEQNSGQILYIFLACLLSIFLILAVQFNSFLKSALVMLTVPLAFTGAIVIIYLYGSINIYSTIGGITLVALITKHGILFMSKDGDVVEMAAERLRPVLMTTVAMILGNIPLLLYTEDAMGPLKQMAYVIVPGLSYGTLMVLIVFPLIISFSEKKALK